MPGISPPFFRLVVPHATPDFVFNGNKKHILYKILFSNTLKENFISNQFLFLYRLNVVYLNSRFYLMLKATGIRGGSKTKESRFFNHVNLTEKQARALQTFTQTKEV